MPTNTSFTGRQVGGRENGLPYFKYPGGMILLSGEYKDIYARFEDRGFEKEVIEGILFNLFGAVTAEAPVPFEELINCQNELVGSEVGEQRGGEVKLRVDRLPRKITRKTLFSACADNKVGVGNA